MAKLNDMILNPVLISSKMLIIWKSIPIIILSLVNNNCYLFLGMPNNNNEHVIVIDRHIGTIINIYEYIYIYTKNTYKWGGFIMTWNINEKFKVILRPSIDGENLVNDSPRWSMIESLLGYSKN